jgi:NTE family protein
MLHEAMVTPMPEPDRIGALRATSIFASYDDRLLGELAQRCVERSLDQGEVLWQAGDPGEDLVLVVSGELEALRVGPDGAEEVIGHIGPGECAGEMAVILDEPRSATIRCRRSARLLSIAASAFRDIARDDPGALAALSEMVSRRATALARRQRPVPAPVVVGVLAEKGQRGASLIAGALARSCARVARDDTLVVRLLRDIPAHGDVPQPEAWVKASSGAGATARCELGVPRTEEAMARMVDQLVASSAGRYRAVVLDFPHMATSAITMAAAACHHVVQICAPDRAGQVGNDRRIPVVNAFGTRGAVNPCSVHGGFVLPVDEWLGAGRLEDQVDERASPAMRVLGRLARRVLGCSVGLALGGGGAFGIAHVGVLMALEEAGVPIDLIAGTSMGSIVAIGYALGTEPKSMLDIAGRIGNVRTALSVLDPSLSGSGLLRGNRLVAIFAPFIPAGRATFEHLDIPCTVVAMDVETGERVDITEGRLDEAFRASCSIPVAFTPVRVAGRVLVDGGMVDPVPADVVRNMGADIVVAVNVVPQLRRGVSTALSRSFQLISKFNPFSHLGGSRSLPDVVDVFMNTLQAVQYELGTYKALQSDVLVNVELAEFTWIDFHRALEIIEQGRVAGAESAAQVLKVLEEHLPAPRR